MSFYCKNCGSKIYIMRNISNNDYKDLLKKAFITGNSIEIEYEYPPMKHWIPYTSGVEDFPDINGKKIMCSEDVRYLVNSGMFLIKSGRIEKRAERRVLVNELVVNPNFIKNQQDPFERAEYTDKIALEKLNGKYLPLEICELTDNALYYLAPSHKCPVCGEPTLCGIGGNTYELEPFSTTYINWDGEVRSSSFGRFMEKLKKEDTYYSKKEVDYCIEQQKTNNSPVVNAQRPNEVDLTDFIRSLLSIEKSIYYYGERLTQLKVQNKPYERFKKRQGFSEQRIQQEKEEYNRAIFHAQIDAKMDTKRQELSLKYNLEDPRLLPEDSPPKEPISVYSWNLGARIKYPVFLTSQKLKKRTEF